MCDLIIKGGKPLSGEITVQGSKNAALPIIAASLLCDGISKLEGCPKISDVYHMEMILRKLGAITWWDKNTLYIDSCKVDGFEILEEYTKKMRSSFILLGVLLARNKKGIIGYPGGCVIGERPIDLHLKVLRKLGADIIEKSGMIYAKTEELKGTEIVFEKVSVGATEQGILASVMAKGKTILKNCSMEPEIIYLCKYLKSMGGIITGEGTPCIQIEGTSLKSGGKIKIPPDRIVAGTYICAAAATRGKITIRNAPMQEMEAFLKVYRKMGGQYEVHSGKLCVDSSQINQAVKDIETEKYPGFPTDMQSLIIAVLITISGDSHVQERIFEARYEAAKEMKKFGADVKIEGKDAWICGKENLHGAQILAKELRGAAALVIAALAVPEETRFTGYSYIERGYENLYEDLKKLGANIKKNTGTAKI